MGFDYGTKALNDAEADRLKEAGRSAARAGVTCFGAGGWKPGDELRAHYWLDGYAEIIPNHPDMPARYRTDGSMSELERMSAGRTKEGA